MNLSQHNYLHFSNKLFKMITTGSAMSVDAWQRTPSKRPYMEQKQIINKSMLLLTVILMDLLAGMEFDLFVPSFPALQNQFGLSPFLVEALLSVNFVGYCLSLFCVGGLADRFGRRPVILVGITIFIIGSIFCLCATSYLLLLVGRFLQGVGVAAP